MLPHQDICLIWWNTNDVSHNDVCKNKSDKMDCRTSIRTQDRLIDIHHSYRLSYDLTHNVAPIWERVLELHPHISTVWSRKTSTYYLWLEKIISNCGWAGGQNDLIMHCSELPTRIFFSPIILSTELWHDTKFTWENVQVGYLAHLCTKCSRSASVVIFCPSSVRPSCAVCRASSTIALLTHFKSNRHETL